MLNYLYFFLYLALTAPLRADLVTLPLTGKTQILEMKEQTLKEISEEKQQELVQPILEAIQNANKSIIGCVYKMDYPLLVNALCAATKKIPVTLFVEKSPYQHEGSDRAQTNIDFLQKTVLRFSRKSTDILKPSFTQNF